MKKQKDRHLQHTTNQKNRKGRSLSKWNKLQEWLKWRSGWQSIVVQKRNLWSPGVSGQWRGISGTIPGTGGKGILWADTRDSFKVSLGIRFCLHRAGPVFDRQAPAGLAADRQRGHVPGISRAGRARSRSEELNFIRKRLSFHIRKVFFYAE